MLSQAQQILSQTQIIAYPALLSQWSNKYIIIKFIDFPEATACYSPQKDAAIAESKKLLLDTLLFRLTSGEEIPPPTSRNNIDNSEGEIIDVSIENVVLSTDEYLQSYYYNKIIAECRPLREKIKNVDRPKRGVIISSNFREWEKRGKQNSSSELRFFNHLVNSSPQMRELVKLIVDCGFDLERFMDESKRRHDQKLSRPKEKSFKRG